MRWSSVLLAAILLAAASPSVEEKRISIYSTVANYNLPVLDREGHEYVGLLEILEPLGTVSARPERDHWNLRFNNVNAEFTFAKKGCKLQGRDVDLGARFLLENGRGLVPLPSLIVLLPRFLGGPVTLHDNSRRLFIGDVAVHFTAQIKKTEPPSLVMDFSAPVNPTIATEPGKLRMTFTREPLVPPGTTTLTFDDKTIPAASYSESNGSAEIAINSSAALFASFSHDGRTITVSTAPTAAPITNPAAGNQSSGTSGPGMAGSPTVLPQLAAAVFAVIDASHGGEERGAALSDQLAEKDVTLAIARRVRQELLNRGLSAMLLRDGDTTLTLDQRVATVNAAHPAVYLCIHAASQGRGTRIYTALLPSTNNSQGPFLDWNTAQSGFLARSQAAAASVASELQAKQITARLLPAPLRPLNNIATAALAIEIAPPGSSIADLTSSDYQNAVASAVASGLATARGHLEDAH